MTESVGRPDRLLAVMAGRWSVVAEIGPDEEVVDVVRDFLGVDSKGC